MKDIIKIDDAIGLNYILQSRLCSFNFKNTSTMFSVNYVLSGTENYIIDGQVYAVVRKNFIMTNPQQEIEVNIEAATDVIGMCYYFHPTTIQQIVQAKSQPIEANLENRDSKENFIIQQTYKENIFNTPINSFLTKLNAYLQKSNLNELNKHQITDFLMLLAENLISHQNQTNYQLNHLSRTKTTTKRELYKRLQKGRQYIHDNLQQPINLKDIAKAACLSEYYFHRNFRNFFNITPHQYHQSVRLQKAHQLLQQGNYSRKELAFHCGFQDPKYFLKVYNRWSCVNQKN